MGHHASSRFWKAYETLPIDIQEKADKAFAQVKADPTHPSIQLKKVGRYWSARVDLTCRALAVEVDDGLLWFWIGHHDEYERIIK